MICSSVKSAKHRDQQCTAKVVMGEWCGKHKTTQIRYVCETISHLSTVVDRKGADTKASADKIIRSWRLWQARKCGPLLHFKSESNNPFDFFSSDPIEEIPAKDFISFVDAGKGYSMDVKSVSALLEHAAKNSEEPVNPFNRNPLTPVFLRRVARRKLKDKWVALEGVSEGQKHALAATDIFRGLEDLGNYTNPDWFIGLSHIGLQRLYIELADIWYHRASLSGLDRARIVPSPAKAFKYPVTTVLIMRTRALKPLLIDTCKTLITAAPAKGDRQLGGMYILGALTLVSEEAAAAFPWLLEMFSPGVSIEHNGELKLAHSSVLAY
jgi:hypothetical protein